MNKLYIMIKVIWFHFLYLPYDSVLKMEGMVLITRSKKGLAMIG